MKRKITLASAIALAMHAQAAFDADSAVLFVYDAADDDTYFVDLGVTAQDLVNGASVDITSAGLASFIASNAGAQWTIIGAINDSTFVGGPPAIGQSFLNRGIVGTSTSGIPVGTTSSANEAQRGVLLNWLADIQVSAGGLSEFVVPGSDPVSATNARNLGFLSDSQITIDTVSSLWYAQAAPYYGALLPDPTVVTQLSGSVLLSSNGQFIAGCLECAPSDGDSDGINDVLDNCPSIPNPDQENLDNDSLGDVCDDDIDGDALLNASDPYPMIAVATIADNRYAGVVGGNDFTLSGYIGAENFSLAGGYLLSHLSLVGHHAPGSIQPTSIDWFIYSSNGSLPSTLLHSGIAANYSIYNVGNDGTYDIARYKVELSASNITLLSGNYWIGFRLNGGSSGEPYWGTANAGTSIDTVSAYSPDNGSSWGGNYPGDNLTFSVHGQFVGSATIFSGDVSGTVNHGESTSGTLAATDADGLTDGTYFTITTPPTYGQAIINPESGFWLYLADVSYLGSDPFTVTVTDDLGYTATQVISISAIGVDTDGDTWYDIQDNCPSDSNIGQEDQDNDGLGDVCDSDRDGDGTNNTFDAFPDDPTEDTDTDGDLVGDNADNCINNPNLNQENFDGDTLGDICDTDIDGDGIANAIEVQFGGNEFDNSDALLILDNIALFSANALTDSDFDSVPDAFEIALGADPNDSTDAQSALDTLLGGISKSVPVMGIPGTIFLFLSMLGLGAVQLNKKNKKGSL